MVGWIVTFNYKHAFFLLRRGLGKQQICFAFWHLSISKRCKYEFAVSPILISRLPVRPSYYLNATYCNMKQLHNKWLPCLCWQTSINVQKLFSLVFTPIVGCAYLFHTTERMLVTFCNISHYFFPFFHFGNAIYCACLFHTTGRMLVTFCNISHFCFSFSILEMQYILHAWFHNKKWGD